MTRILRNASTTGRSPRSRCREPSKTKQSHLRNAMDATYRELIPFRNTAVLIYVPVPAVFVARTRTYLSARVRLPGYIRATTHVSSHARARDKKCIASWRETHDTFGTKNRKWECRHAVFLISLDPPARPDSSPWFCEAEDVLRAKIRIIALPIRLSPVSRCRGERDPRVHPL